jgi:hypothetical protein
MSYADLMTKFLKNNCAGKTAGVCRRDLCDYSGAGGCTHPQHPKNLRQRSGPVPRGAKPEVRLPQQEDSGAGKCNYCVAGYVTRLIARKVWAMARSDGVTVSEFIRGMIIAELHRRDADAFRPSSKKARG